MSDKQPGKVSMADFSTWSETQLQALLSAELAAEETDAALIQRAVAALNQKRGKAPSRRDVDAAWESFVQDHSVSQPLYPDLSADGPAALRSSRRRCFCGLAKAAAIAAAALVLLTLTVSALGYDLWSRLVAWTDETFSFSAGKAEEDGAVPTYAPGLEELDAVLRENGVTEQVLPTWLPDGYVQTEFYSFKDADRSTFLISIWNTEDNSSTPINLCYIVRTDWGDLQYQKNVGNPHIYTTHGIDHYLLLNVESNMAVWLNENVECLISGLQSQVDLAHMIDSIYLKEEP